MKTCATCKTTLDLESFHRHTTGKYGRESSCKPCLLERLRIRRQNNPGKARSKEKEWRTRTPQRQKGKSLQKYWPGSSWKEALDNFNQLLEAQNNLCKICNKPETCAYNKDPSKGKIRDLCVDHCHATGKVRGLLCDNCNVMIGRARDNADICISASVYLKAA